MKYIFNLSLAFTINIILFLVKEKTRVLAIVCLIFFPFIIKFMGKDALSISTLSIYLFFTYFFIENRLFVYFFTKKLNVIIFFLIIVAIISTLHVPIGQFTGPAVRKLSDFMSASLLFLFITNLKFKDDVEKNAFLESLISVVLISIAVQVLLAIIYMKFPAVHGMLSYFTLSHEETLQMRETRGMMRIRSLILTPESFGEIMAVSAPFVLYKMFKYKFIPWFFVYAIYGIGEILTVTRSGMVLFALGSLLFIVFNFRKIKTGRLFAIIFSFIIATIVLIVKKPEFLESSLFRFGEALAIYQKTGDIASTINRAGVWSRIEYIFDNLNFFGHGLIPAYKYVPEIKNHFHNMWITLTYQYGIVGVLLYVVLFFSLLLKNIKASYLRDKKEKILATVATVSLSLFLINEIKYDFNRTEAYQQLCWVFFAIFVLISTKISSSFKVRNP